MHDKSCTTVPTISKTSSSHYVLIYVKVAVIRKKWLEKFKHNTVIPVDLLGEQKVGLVYVYGS